MLPAHSPIGPSSAALIQACPGSLKAQDAAGRPEAGEAAERGTELHALAERLLRSGDTVPADTPEPVHLHVDAVSHLAAAAGVAPLIEYRVDGARYHPELFGTLDAAVVDLKHGVLSIVDLKSGFHHVAADALQLLIYAALFYLSLPAADARRIRWIDTIVVQLQPNSEPIRRARHRVADVLRALDTYVEAAHVATDSANPPRAAGSWCKQYFCSARTTCPTFHALTLAEAQAEFRA
jgi:hypothetical protein